MAVAQLWLDNISGVMSDCFWCSAQVWQTDGHNCRSPIMESHGI